MQAVCFIVLKYRCTNAKRIGTGKYHSLAEAAPAEGTFWGGMLAVGSKLGIDTCRVESHSGQCKS